MRYLGGKHRQSKETASVIQELRGGRTRYVEPFIGGGSVFQRVAPAFSTAIGGDASPSLIRMWEDSVFSGWAPPVKLDKAEWLRLKTADDSALKAWAGYAASYNGKWFAGYGPRAAGRDYLAESARGLERKVKALGAHSGLSFVCSDFASHEVDANTVVYCDPPYADTEQYGAVGGFDHGRFWAVAESWSKSGALVLVHEYAAPGGWEAVHSRDRTETMNHAGPSSGKRQESLYLFTGSLGEG